MTTAEEIHAEIASVKQLVEKARTQEVILREKWLDAEHRQALRRNLDALRSELGSINASKLEYSYLAASTDEDVVGPNLPGCRSQGDHFVRNSEFQSHANNITDFSAAVVSGEIEWTVKGFSWMKDSLAQYSDDFSRSPTIEVGGHEFNLAYSPEYDLDWFEDGDCGSLVVVHREPQEYEGAVFRYSILIKSNVRGFVQWGETGNICRPDENTNEIFGPDVCSAPGPAAGIFGLSHENLGTSEWVTDDTLTIKLKVEVKPRVSRKKRFCKTEACSIEVPPPSLGDQLLLLLSSEASSDVTFMVQGERIRAHSSILSARSELLQRQLTCGMKESVSKEIVVEDCEAAVFKVFLHYLYSDCFDSLLKLIKECVKDMSSSSAANESTTSCTAFHAPRAFDLMPMFQKLLAVSHKYQISRLRLWCESQLCECICTSHACSVLRQAHLYEADQLERRCLDFIRDNMVDIVNTDSFASLMTECPQASLKITLHNAGLADPQDNARKRKRNQ